MLLLLSSCFTALVVALFRSNGSRKTESIGMSIVPQSRPYFEPILQPEILQVGFFQQMT